LASRSSKVRRLALLFAAVTATLMVGAAPGTAGAANDGDTATAREFFALLSSMDVEGWAGLWADDGRIIVPYPPEGFPATIDGKTEIVSGFRDLFDNFERFSTTLTGVYPAADSDAVTVEYLVDAQLRSGARYTNDNIAVFRFRGGKITEYHDYFDPRRFQVVVDALPAASESDR